MHAKPTKQLGRLYKSDADATVKKKIIIKK